MGLIAFAVLGILVGALVRSLVREEAAGGALFTMVIGMVGGLIGGVFAGALTDADPLVEFFNLITWGGAVAGAIVILAIYLLITES
ncbi:MAG TPA: GlsB/YeaQ/YmgE family stress response membrane protein [Egibacteraceae bacterium]|nr:GlsB/YeaQ/YmgE family stress response membrane protein [Egibacteraceae bacterium]